MKIEKIETNIKKNLFFKRTIISDDNITDLGNLETELIVLYPNIQYQEFIGFGGAFTESGAYALSKAPKEIYNKALAEYFSNEGLGYTLCRTHINSCDFSLGNYAYLDDANLDSFNLERDKKYLLPMILNALKINPHISFLASPWSPPAFMKTNNQMNQGGKLKEKYKQLWVDSLVKYIKEYKSMGICIDYMTIQNEPKAVQTWESCIYTAEEEAELIRNYIYPTFQRYNINTKLLIWDHNKERLFSRSKTILEDEKLSSIIDGVAYHYYSGDYFENIQLVREKYPNQILFHTEGCTGYSKYSKFFNKKTQINNAETYAHDIIGDLNAGANGYIDWNMFLDYYGRTKS